MDAQPTSFIWVFNGGHQFPGGLFTTIELAEQWIAKHGLSGVLTRYPVDEGCFDWALRIGLFQPNEEKLEQKRRDKKFIGGFSSASQDHHHYDDGQRVA